MTTLTLEQARKDYAEKKKHFDECGNNSFRAIMNYLEEKFGRENLIPKPSLFERVKCWEDAVKIKCKSRDAETFYNAFNTYQKLTTVIELFNEGWLPDWNNFEKCKYFIEYNNITKIFEIINCRFSQSCPNELYLKDKATAKHLITYFADLYYEYFGIKK